VRTVLKWIGIVLGGLVGVVIVAAIVLNIVTSARVNRVYDIEPEAVTIPTDAAELARGEYLVKTFCTQCHGASLGGGVLFEQPGVVAIYAANISPGEGGVSDFSDGDLVRAMRHGVDPEGHALFVMPAEIIVNWSDEDLGAAIAYLRTLPPVNQEVPPNQFSVMARALLPLGAFGQPMAVEYIDHDAPFPDRPEIGVTAEYGQYTAGVFACTLCHGEGLTGMDAPPPNAQPGSPPAPDLTDVGAWSQADFVKTVTTGITPSGETIDPEIMPVDLYAGLGDQDLEALYVYIQSLGG